MVLMPEVAKRISVLASVNQADSVHAIIKLGDEKCTEYCLH